MALHFSPTQPLPFNPQMPLVTKSCRNELTLCKLLASTLITGAVDIAIGSHVPRPFYAPPSNPSQESAPLLVTVPWYSFAQFPDNPLMMQFIQYSGNYMYYPGSGDSEDASDSVPDWQASASAAAATGADSVLTGDLCYPSITNFTTVLPSNPLNLLQGTLLLAGGGPQPISAPSTNVSLAPCSRWDPDCPPIPIIQSPSSSDLNRMRVLVASHVQYPQGFVASGAAVDALYVNPSDTPAFRTSPSAWLCALAATLGISSTQCQALDLNPNAPKAVVAHAIVYGDNVDITLRTRDGHDTFVGTKLSETHSRLSVDLNGGHDTVNVSASNMTLQIYTGPGADTVNLATDLNGRLTLSLGDDDDDADGERFVYDSVQINSYPYYAQSDSVNTFDYQSLKMIGDDWTAVWPLGANAKNSVVLLRGLAAYFELHVFYRAPPAAPTATTTTTTTTTVPSTSTTTTRTTLVSTTTTTTTPVQDCCWSCTCNSCSACTHCKGCGWCAASPNPACHSGDWLGAFYGSCIFELFVSNTQWDWEPNQCPVTTTTTTSTSTSKPATTSTSKPATGGSTTTSRHLLAMSTGHESRRAGRRADPADMPMEVDDGASIGPRA